MIDFLINAIAHTACFSLWAVIEHTETAFAVEMGFLLYVIYGEIRRS